jgi:hypothetical protein
MEMGGGGIICASSALLLFEDLAVDKGMRNLAALPAAKNQAKKISGLKAEETRPMLGPLLLMYLLASLATTVPTMI